MKDGEIKIVNISAVPYIDPRSSAEGFVLVYGLGEDNKTYEWDASALSWKLFDE